MLNPTTRKTAVYCPIAARYCSTTLAGTRPRSLDVDAPVHAPRRGPPRCRQCWPCARARARPPDHTAGRARTRRISPTGDRFSNLAGISALPARGQWPRLVPVRPVGAPAVHVWLELVVAAGGDLEHVLWPVKRIGALGVLADPVGPSECRCYVENPSSAACAVISLGWCRSGSRPGRGHEQAQPAAQREQDGEEPKPAGWECPAHRQTSSPGGRTMGQNGRGSAKRAVICTARSARTLSAICP